LAAEWVHADPSKPGSVSLPGDKFRGGVVFLFTLSPMSEKGTPMKTTTIRPGEKGDVPGWVLITLMTAGLVVVIWSAAGPALSGVFEQAITRVTGF
jgi:hypothetical protein